jgi:hypothetical protein
MKITTIQGKRSTTPSGTEMVELPFNRKGLRKNSSLDASVCFLFAVGKVSCFSNDIGSGEGMRFIARRTTSMIAVYMLSVWRKCCCCWGDVAPVPEWFNRPSVRLDDHHPSMM